MPSGGVAWRRPEPVPNCYPASFRSSPGTFAGLTHVVYTASESAIPALPLMNMFICVNDTLAYTKSALQCMSAHVLSLKHSYARQIPQIELMLQKGLSLMPSFCYFNTQQACLARLAKLIGSISRCTK